MITVALFKKKKQETEEKTPEQIAEESKSNVKGMLLEKLNEKLKGTLYDDCVIMPKTYTIDIQVISHEEREGYQIIHAVYIVKNDEFDEPLIDPVDSQGKTLEEAVDMSVNIFFAGVWHPIDQSMTKTHPKHIPVDYLNQHYDFDMYCQSVVRIGVKDKDPSMLINQIMNEVPKYLGSKKYYWFRIFLAQTKDKKMLEVRVNGSVCPELSEKFKPYVEKWDANDGFCCEKQYAIFVQREADQCPFDKQTVMEAGKEAIERMVKIRSREDYDAMSDKLIEMTGDKGLAAEIRIFIPEIFAKLTLGYREGDSLFLIEDEGEEHRQIEFKKTQLRSYFYLQQAILEYLGTKPPQEDVQRIVFNSVAFKEMRKATEQAKENGHEIKPSDLFVPGTSYKVGVENYKVW